MLCCPRRVSLCRMQLPESPFGPSLRRGLGPELPSWLRGMAGGWVQKAFAHPILLPHEGEPVGIGFRALDTTSKAAGPREPGAAQPRFALWRAQGRGEKGLRCFPEPRRLRDVVCFGREFPFAECSSQKLVFVGRCDGASALCGRAGSGGMAGVWAKKAFAGPILLAHEGEPIWSGFQAPESPSKASGTREPGQSGPALPYGERRARGENSLRCFHEPRRFGTMVAARG